MPSAISIKYYFRYPLMWVMLLWALTLPGHELAVYSLLVKGSIAEVAAGLGIAPAGEDTGSVKKPAVQVFEDAKASSSVVLSPLQTIRASLLRLAFLPPSVDFPICASEAIGGERIAQLFLISLLPNAP
ncbi:hypothetical protein OB13_10475 [Pontibacter sp. HJ8]